jgi:hypothetical protein
MGRNQFHDPASRDDDPSLSTGRQHGKWILYPNRVSHHGIPALCERVAERDAFVAIIKPGLTRSPVSRSVASAVPNSGDFHTFAAEPRVTDTEAFRR